MRGEAGPVLIERWMADLRTTTPYAAIHTGVPSPDDPTANEAVGAWYTRKAFTWDALDDTAVANVAPFKWVNMPAIVVVGIAVYTSATGSGLLLWCPYSPPQQVLYKGSLSIAAHDLYVEII